MLHSLLVQVLPHQSSPSRPRERFSEKLLIPRLLTRRVRQADALKRFSENFSRQTEFERLVMVPMGNLIGMFGETENAAGGASPCLQRPGEGAHQICVKRRNPVLCEPDGRAGLGGKLNGSPRIMITEQIPSLFLRTPRASSSTTGHDSQSSCSRRGRRRPGSSEAVVAGCGIRS